MLLGHEADVEEAEHLAELHRRALHRPQRGDDLLRRLEVAALERRLPALLVARQVRDVRAELSRALIGGEAGDLGGARDARGRDPVLRHRGGWCQGTGAGLAAGGSAAGAGAACGAGVAVAAGAGVCVGTGVAVGVGVGVAPGVRVASGVAVSFSASRRPPLAAPVAVALAEERRRVARAADLLPASSSEAVTNATARTKASAPVASASFHWRGVSLKPREDWTVRCVVVCGSASRSSGGGGASGSKSRSSSRPVDVAAGGRDVFTVSAAASGPR